VGLLLLGSKAHPLSSVLFVKWIDRSVNRGPIYRGKILLIWLFVVGFFFIGTDSPIYLVVGERRPFANKFFGRSSPGQDFDGLISPLKGNTRSSYSLLILSCIRSGFGHV
jgi:hypothetical protein